MRRSKIEWTDYSGGNANFVVRGKTPGECEVGPGCAHCYVTRLIARASGIWPDRTTFHPDKLQALARCRPRPGKTSYRRGPAARPMVFVCDTGDLFHKAVPASAIVRALDVFYERSDVDWQVLTKRADRAAFIITRWLKGRGLAELPPNIWLVFSVEDATHAWQRVPHLVDVPAAVRGLSVEPILGVLDLSAWLYACPDCGARPCVGSLRDWRYDGERWQHHHGYPIGHVRTEPAPLLHWIAMGGESGPRPRPAEPHALRRVRNQATDAGVALFFKQWGDYTPPPGEERARFLAAGWDPGAFRGGHVLDGQVWDQFPKQADVWRPLLGADGEEGGP
jgi:protein gp37